METRPPVPRLFWALVALGPTVVWLLLVSVQDTTLFLDWTIYRQGFDLWRSTGTPYTVLPPGWNPCQSYPYLYPPTSWPLMPITAVLPPVMAALGVLPILWRPPRLWYVPVAAALLIVGLGPALYLANVNLIVAGLIVLSFWPGRLGGIAFGLVVAIKLYPIVLLPLLWGDRTRLRWFCGVFGGLFVSGTLLFGIRGWLDFGTTLVNEGPHCGTSWNPLAWLGPLRIAIAGGIALIGLAMGSPTVSLIGTTWASGVVTQHYMVTFAAALCTEPPIGTTLAALRGNRQVRWLRSRAQRNRDPSGA